MQNNNKKIVKIAIAGLGSVGCALFQIIEQNNRNVNSQYFIEIIAASARSKKDFLNNSAVKFFLDPLEMIAKSSEAQIIIELIGGVEIAREVAIASLKAKKHFITANKAMLAQFGSELMQMAKENAVALNFEASVGGSIPIIKIIGQHFANQEIKQIYAILNGTSNFILSKMHNENINFDTALKQAQDLGFAEANPEFDIAGIDSAHKIAILAGIATDNFINFSTISIEGIKDISLETINFAKDFGYKIKLLAFFEQNSSTNTINYAIFPALVKNNSQIAMIDNNLNIISLNVNNVGWQYFSGAGAGGIETASAVLSDIINITKNNNFDYYFLNEKSYLNLGSILEDNSNFMIHFTFSRDQFNKLKFNNLLQKIGQILNFKITEEAINIEACFIIINSSKKLIEQVINEELFCNLEKNFVKLKIIRLIN